MPLEAPSSLGTSQWREDSLAPSSIEPTEDVPAPIGPGVRSAGDVVAEIKKMATRRFTITPSRQMQISHMKTDKGASEIEEFGLQISPYRIKELEHTMRRNEGLKRKKGSKMSALNAFRALHRKKDFEM